MKVQVLGMGCAKCNNLAANVAEAIADAGLDIEVEKVEDLTEIMKFGVMMTPALAVDGEVKSIGKVLSVAEISDILQGP